ncbi:linker for activation of T-cells family member 2-like isoform X2 [Leucoraja erinacea]|uniref:linker for activation of T-cells family member 2-like isoform X2 n=1 Tax=Leucoraja erinaceus TaxID=7782 RepID=UPI0024538CF5|nr:linker for activation of T-cells family member 2-like isoform X2 [Leucoraja erinacea]
MYPQLWWAVLSILFSLPLGTLVLLCMRCRKSRSRTIIREETRRKTQSVQMNDEKKGFEVVRSYTVSRSGQKPSPEPETENEPATNVVISPDCQDIQPSYMNVNIENNHRLDQDYINPLSADYYCTPSEYIKSADDDDDSNSYENVQINKVASQTSETSGENDDEDDEEPDYVNAIPCPSL